MKKVLLLLSLASGTLFFGACHKSSSSPATTANVMFVNGCTGAGLTQVTANSASIPGASALGFLNYSPYQSINEGAVSMAWSINTSGLITPLISQSVSLTAASYYSVYVGGIFTKPAFIFATDDMTAPASGFAKVRFVNLSGDTLNESCFIGTPSIATNVGYGTITPFFQVAAQTGVTVLFLDPANPTKLASLPNQTFAAGKIYTIMLTGISVGTGSTALGLKIINNN
jgi:Domain of unknown function (DUF4397)